MSLHVPGGPGVRLEVPLAQSTVRAPGPPPPAVERLPGARLEGFTVADDGALTVQLGCASAPSGRWVPGLESVVLERAMGLALAPLGLRPGRLERVEPPALPGTTARVRWAGDGGDGRRIDLVHVLAFAGDDTDAVACSAVCLEPTGGERCGPLLDGLRLDGALRPPPPPGPLARAVSWSAVHPLPAAALLGAILVALVAALLARRPHRPIAARRARARGR